ncbi:MAG: MBL fold metallo-hydrolase [Anaerolineae bacterium]
MEIEWHGLGCFRLTERGCPSIVTDPFDESQTGLRLPQAEVDIVTSSLLLEDSREATWPRILGTPRTLAAPGEYEIGGVFITGVASSRARKRGTRPERNVVYTINYDGVAVCHLGELTRAPTQAEVEAMGRVTVLLVPVGMPGGMTPAVASETVSLIEPEIVVPMQYRVPGLRIERKPVAGFLKEMGVTDPSAVPSLRVTSGGEPDELQVVLLEPQ